jgi:hypothetical protein
VTPKGPVWYLLSIYTENYQPCTFCRITIRYVVNANLPDERDALRHSNNFRVTIANFARKLPQTAAPRPRSPRVPAFRITATEWSAVPDSFDQTKNKERTLVIQSALFA